MAEHVFLCGLSKEQRAEVPVGTILSFEKGIGNLNLKLDRMRKRLVGAEPERLTDFIEIASYVFAADRTTSRGDLTDRGFGEQWRRSFRLIIAVRDPLFWQRPDVNGALGDALGFLSEDWWKFEFVENYEPIPLQQYLGLKLQEDYSEGGTSIVLFSGGLDSLAGAVHELRTTNRHVVLVSHRNLSTIGERQKMLAARLAEGFPQRVTHAWVDNSLTVKLPPGEETQRSRTFFFTAMAAVAAHIETSDRIRFYENGVMSVNLPFATQLVGARSSRSTHPRSLQLLKRLVDLVSMHQIDIDNPFIWKTKVDVVRELASTDQARLIEGTISCSRSQFAIKWFQPHCGTCVQCLQRQISTLAAGAEAFDEAEGYDTDFLEGPREDGDARVMAVETIKLALDCFSVSDRDFLGRFSEPLAWLLRAYPSGEGDDVAKRVIELYRRHGEAVRSIFVKAIGDQAARVVDQALPQSSLLSLVLKERLVVPVLGPTTAPAAVRLSEPKPDRMIEGDTIFVAVDEQRQAIRISDRPELRGQSIFQLIKFLIEVSLAERAKPGLPQAYRSVRARTITDKLSLANDEAVRAAISRARVSLEEAATVLGVPSDQNEVIESTKYGYRLNPKVQVVTIEEFLRK